MSYIPDYNNIIGSNYSSKNKLDTNFNLLNNNKFAELLDERIKQYGKQVNWLSLMGIQATEPVFDNGGFNIQDLVSSAKQALTNAAQDTINQFAIPKLTAFMSSPFDLHNPENRTNSNIYNFIKKSAANCYNKCASSAVTNLSEFVKDAMKIS